MWQKAALALVAAIYLIVLPLLEINDTHLVNPAWPGHARLHEAWQLITHALLALLALWLLFARRQVRGAALLLAIPTIGFLAAWLLMPAYGGTMRHADGTELALAGVNVAVLVMWLAFALLLGVLARPGTRRRV